MYSVHDDHNRIKESKSCYLKYKSVIDFVTFILFVSYFVQWILNINLIVAVIMLRLFCSHC